MTINMLRGVGNQHVELSRVLWAASVVAGIIYAGVQLIAHKQFSIVEFGTGMGLLLAGGGAGTAIKDTAVAKAAATQGAGE